MQITYTHTVSMNQCYVIKYIHKRYFYEKKNKFFKENCWKVTFIACECISLDCIPLGIELKIQI